MINPVIFLIFGGVVGSILLLSFILNAIGAVAGPWSRLASEWPAEQPPSTKPQVAVFAVTSQPYSVADEPQFRRTGLIYALCTLLGMGLIIVIAGMLMGWIQSPNYIRMLTIAIFAMFTFTICYWGLRFLRRKAFPQMVEYHADDDHLHIRRDSDILARYPWISIPWAAIDDINLDPANPGKVRFHMGPYWAYADREMVQRELQLRSELTKISHHEPARF